MISGGVISALTSEIGMILTVPILIIAIVRIRTRANLVPALVGALAYFTLAVETTAIINYLLFREGSAGAAFMDNHPVFYMIYSMVMTIGMEELSRFLTFRFILQKRNSKRSALLYGVGHGAVEGIIAGGLPAFLSLSYATVINEFGTEKLLENVEAVAVDDMKKAIDGVLGLTSGACIADTVVRFSGIILQIALSIVVYYAVSRQLYLYLWLGVAAHALTVMPSILAYVGVIGNSYVEAGIYVLLVVATTYAAFKLYMAEETGFDPFFHRAVPIINEPKIPVRRKM